MTDPSCFCIFAFMQEAAASPTRKKNRQGWSETIKKEKISTLRFTGESGIVGLDLEKKYTALECFRLFLDDDLINLMVSETNK